MENTPSHEPNLHFVVIPWLAQGHMLPTIDIARLLAERGVTVTVVTTPVNAARMRPTIDRISAADSGLALRFVSVRFPSAEFGLPEGCENLDSVPSREMIPSFFQASKLLKGEVLDRLRDLSPPPSCMISGVCYSWADEVARELGVPRFVFHGFSCFSLLSVESLYLHKPQESVRSMSEPFLVPDMPHEIFITKHQLPRQFQPQYASFCDEMRAPEVAADGVVVNSFDELEPGYAERFAAVSGGRKVWMIGPVALRNQGNKEDMAARGNKAAVDAEQCMRWLDSMKPGSVLYVSFGSVSSFPASQLTEMGAGLLASGRPFVWVIKKVRESSPEFEKWLSDNFEGNQKCLLIRGWAPQVMLLSHAAVGGFMTHCGWNSTLEAVSAGVPLITWPLQSEQFLNERLILEVLKIGVGIGVDKPVDAPGVEEIRLVRREEVAVAVKRLMDEEEEGEARRRRAEELGKKAKGALEYGGSSYVNLTRLIQYVADQRRAREN